VIICAHLLDDCSGSPRVLAQVIEGLQEAGENVRLFVGHHEVGRLSEVSVPTARYWYRRGSHRLVTLFTYFFSQGFLFWKLLWSPDLDRNAIIYVNTLLPFGAALFGGMTGRPVVYHLHEISVSPAPLRWFLVAIARLTARQLIYVSDAHRVCLPIEGVPARTIHNALDAAFLRRAGESVPNSPEHGDNFRVLMLASLRGYKGIPEFVALARRFMSHSGMTFHLVANDEDAEIQRYFANQSLPGNLTVYPRTADPADHYSRASLVVNLSRPDQWVETFGLTLIEAMAFGIPVIAPPVGGPAEVVADGEDGFLVDCRDEDALASRVEQLWEDKSLYLKMSGGAREHAKRFSAEHSLAKLQAVIAEVSK